MKRIFLLPLGLTFVLITWLFVGIYFDDEFFTPSLFLKHRPTFQIVFQSSIGMSDLELSDLSVLDRVKELHFQEFVLSRWKFHAQSPFSFLIPILLIQLSTTLLIGFIFSIIQLGKLGFHLFINYLPCAFLIGIGIFHFPSWASTSSWVACIMMEILSAWILSRSNPQNKKGSANGRSLG